MEVGVQNAIGLPIMRGSSAGVVKAEHSSNVHAGTWRNSDLKDSNLQGTWVVCKLSASWKPVFDLPVKRS